MIDYSDTDKASLLFSRDLKDIESVLNKTFIAVDKLNSLAHPTEQQIQALDIANDNISVIAMILSVKKLWVLMEDVELNGWDNPRCQTFISVKESNTLLMSSSQYQWVGLSDNDSKLLEDFTTKASKEISRLYTPHPSGMCFCDDVCGHINSHTIATVEDLDKAIYLDKIAMESKEDISLEKFYGMDFFWTTIKGDKQSLRIVIDRSLSDSFYCYEIPTEDTYPHEIGVWKDLRDIADSISSKFNNQDVVLMGEHS